MKRSDFVGKVIEPIKMPVLKTSQFSKRAIMLILIREFHKSACTSCFKEHFYELICELRNK